MSFSYEVLSKWQCCHKRDSLCCLVLDVFYLLGFLQSNSVPFKMNFQWLTSPFSLPKMKMKVKNVIDDFIIRNSLRNNVDSKDLPFSEKMNLIEFAACWMEEHSKRFLQSTLNHKSALLIND